MKNFAIAAILAVAMSLGACVEEKPTGGDIVQPGDPVPEFAVTTGDGAGTKSFTGADFIGKRSIIVFFWTPCRDCRRELPIVHEAWLTLKDVADVRFIAVSRGETPEAVAAYWTSGAENKPSFEPMPYYLDPDASAFNKFADSYVPRIYLADTAGKIQNMIVEKFDLTADDLVKLIEGLK